MTKAIPNTLLSKVKEIEILIGPKMINKLSLDDLKALYFLSIKIQDSVSDVLNNAFPNFVVSQNKQFSPTYNSNNSNNYNYTKPSVTENPNNNNLTIPSDLGTGFTAGGVGLFDVTEEVNNNLVNRQVIETIKAQNPEAVIEEKPFIDELGKLNDIFGSVQDV